VASGKNADAKEWLRFMLSNCKDTLEKLSAAGTAGEALTNGAP